MAVSESDTEAIAAQILAASESVASIPPISDGRPDFSLDDAYRVAGRVMAQRVARGEKPVGWKIGFTNTTIWDEYGVHAPIWGPVYDSTIAAAEAGPGPTPCAIGMLVEPRIEPEIVFRLARPPHPDMDEAALLACIDAVAHGFEIVQSIFPAWRFKAADTIAAFALHGRLRHGPFQPVDAANRSDWLDRLGRFEIALSRDGQDVDRGVAANVLGGPLSALRHFVRGLERHPLGRGLNAGDLVTTGTITRAFPVAAGETWRTEVSGLPTPGLAIRFT